MPDLVTVSWITGKQILGEQVCMQGKNYKKEKWKCSFKSVLTVR